MSPAVLREKVHETIDRLPADQLERVAGYLDALATARPRGVPLRSLLKHAGVLDPESAREMREAIEEGCERVDPRDW